MGGLEVLGVRLQTLSELDPAEHTGQAVLLASMPLLLVAPELALERMAAVLGHLGQRGMFKGF